jgi:hypothetical protein
MAFPSIMPPVPQFCHDDGSGVENSIEAKKLPADFETEPGLRRFFTGVGESRKA